MMIHLFIESSEKDIIIMPGTDSILRIKEGSGGASLGCVCISSLPQLAQRHAHSIKPSLKHASVNNLL